MSARQKYACAEMPVSNPRDSTIAVVGDGFGSLIVYATAVYLGFRPQEITIYGPSDNPVKTYQQFAFNLGQTVLRSESESHFLPADWPTFAELEAWSRRSPSPAGPIRSAEVQPRRARHHGRGTDRPPASSAGTTTATRHEGRLAAARGLERRDPHFVLYDEEARFIGRAKHVMLACGHGPLSFPPCSPRRGRIPLLADRIVQAYAPKTYDPERPLHRDRLGHRFGQRMGERDRRRREVHLAVPQPDPGRAGPEHAALLLRGARDRRLPGTGLRPADGVPRPDPQGDGAAPARWERTDRNGPQEGRFEQIIGEIDEIQPGRSGLRVHVMSKHGEDPGWLDVTGVVTGTGLQQVRAHRAAAAPTGRVLQRADRRTGRIKLQSNCGVPGLDRPDSRMCVMGIHANSVDHARRHDRRPQVHRAALRRRLLRGGAAEAAPFPVASGDAARLSRETARVRSGTSVARSSWPDVPDRPRPRADASCHPDRPGDPRHDPLAGHGQRGLDRDDRDLPRSWVSRWTRSSTRT